MDEQQILEDFHPVVREWFRRTYTSPTPPQMLGWPSIAAGNNSLILAPTGSGKTLAAFLWAINHLIDQRTREELEPGVRILYVSPLKALNNDIERNLKSPLKGLRDQAHAMGISLPAIRSAVRTGDTPQSRRESIIKTPPDILITTPESLYLMLTAKRPRAIFRTVQYVIIDEIHSLCNNKRGVHLSLSLERLQQIADQEFVRIGLSATQRPLETIAAYLGGMAWTEDSTGHTLRQRPVTIIDAGSRKKTDLRVTCPIADFSALPEEGAWPAIYDELLANIRSHRTTLIFVNNRRLAERLAARINELILPPEGEDRSGMTNLYAVPVRTPRADKDSVPPEHYAPPAEQDAVLVQAYHGSMSREARESMEAALKAGEIRALAATSSLELGIDIGSIDLVVQVESPKGIARGLQRIGRSGHLVNASSKGRIIPTHREDLVEAAVVARAMLDHDVEPTAVPENCLDVLAQQIVAMVAAEECDVETVYRIVRQSYCYRSLSRQVFDNVLGMLAGRYADETFRELRARVSWDRVNNVLRSLPGTSHLAITSGGTIADRGYYGVYLEDGRTKVGEVDEEFIYESRVGDTFILGSSVWKIAGIDANRVSVVPAPGQPARMPFWRGEGIGRSYDLGERVGAFRRTLSERLGDDTCLEWLEKEFPLDDNASWNILEYFRRQQESTGFIPHDKLLLVEGFRDEIGDPRIVVHSPFGRSVNGLLGLLASRRLRELTGIDAQMLYNDDGVLLRTSDREDLPLDLFAGVTPERAREIILDELFASPLFAGQFRQNAARALLMPKIAPGKRTPLWLQRLRAGDLLEIVQRHKDFPIVLETVREVLTDILDFRRFLALVEAVRSGTVTVASVSTEAPSPFAASLLFEFTAVYMYAADAARSPAGAAPVDNALLSELVPIESMTGFFRPEALDSVTARLQHTAPGSQARSAEELMQIILRLGDLTDAEIAERCAGDAAGWIAILRAQGRIVRFHFPDEDRWIAAESLPLYETLLTETGTQAVLRRYLQNHGPVTRSLLARRYGVRQDRLDALEASWASDRQMVRGRFGPGTAEDQWCFRQNIERVHRQTIAILRKEIEPCSLRDVALLLQRWTKLTTSQGATVETLLEQMQGLPLPVDSWERDILRPRVKGYSSEKIHALTRSGTIIWAGAGAGRMMPIIRGNGAMFLSGNQESAELSEASRRILTFLRDQGAVFFADIRSATHLSLEAINTGLAELFWNGLISNDAYTEILALKRTTRQAQGPIEPVQMVDPYHNPRRVRMMSTVRRALDQVPGWTGRWFLLNTPAVQGETLSASALAAAQARQLLDRYGILLRESLTRETTLPWSSLAPALQQMELRGEIRRGYFVEGLSGVQYALPSAAEELQRLHTRQAKNEGVHLIAACDPANPYGPGIDLSGDEPLRLLRNSGHYVAFIDGSPFLLIESNGEKIRTLGQPDPSLVEEAMRRFVDLLRLPEPLRPFKEIIIEYWNEKRPGGLPEAEMLRRLRFQRDRDQTLRIDLYSC